MLEIKKVINLEMCEQCDVLLTKLIQSDRKFDSNTKETYVVNNNYSKKYDKDYACLFLAYFNTVPVGFIYGYWKFETGDFVYESTAYIDALYVEEAYRNKGIASALITQFNDWCKERNITIVEISVYKDNKNALCLYEKRGFKVNTYYMSRKII